MTTPENEHLQRRTLSISVYIPDHPDRSNTPIFERTRRKLITHNVNAKCAVDNEHCDHDHPLELHHSHVEWCDSNGVDWGKVKTIVPDFDWETFDISKPETFIDSEYNANVVLCKKHHTAPDHGIHCLDGPTWQMQVFKRSNFVFSPDEE
jgi:hypothetical protein